MEHMEQENEEMKKRRKRPHDSFESRSGDLNLPDSEDNVIPADRQTFGGLHSTTLYNLNESTSGELYDPATGIPYDNDHEPAFDTPLPEVEPNGDGSEDVLGAMPKENDAAAKWLREYERKNKPDLGQSGQNV